MKKKIAKMVSVLLAVALVSIVAIAATGCADAERDRFDRVQAHFTDSADWTVDTIGLPAGATARFMFTAHGGTLEVAAFIWPTTAQATTHVTALTGVATGDQQAHGAGRVSLFTTNEAAMTYIRNVFNEVTPNPLPAAPVLPATPVVGAGTWRVGAGLDIAPGRFLLLQVGNLAGSVVVRTAPGTGTENLVFINNFDNRLFIDLEAGQHVEIARAALWEVDDVAPIDKFAAYWAAGQYLVGVDIHPGVYRFVQVGTIMASVTVRSSPNSLGTTNLVSIQNFENQHIIQLEEGQFVEFARSRMEVVTD
ncbi:MAG: hypothetical protein FWC82_00375 [Firmicutes bacterium]|nr:hypothetical protein [Bacillota bacterium]